MLDFLSYNIQAGIGTLRPRDYLIRAHRQILPVRPKRDNLDKIAAFIGRYDVVCLQEVDLGGFRSGYINQAQYLKNKAKFPHMATQINRKLGRLSLHGNVILSKHRIKHTDSYALPGSMTGRGLLVSELDTPNSLTIANTHFSLGEADQIRQFAFVQSKLAKIKRVILSVDFNCTPTSRALRAFDDISDLDMATEDHHQAFPAWRPEKAIDHIFVSKRFGDVHCSVGNVQYSDHLPLSMRLQLLT